MGYVRGLVIYHSRTLSTMDPLAHRARNVAPVSWGQRLGQRRATENHGGGRLRSPMKLAITSLSAATPFRIGCCNNCSASATTRASKSLVNEQFGSLTPPAKRGQMARRLDAGSCVRRLRRGVKPATRPRTCCVQCRLGGHSPRGNARSTRGVARRSRIGVGREDLSHRPRTAAGRFCSPTRGETAWLIWGLPRQRSLQLSGDQTNNCGNSVNATPCAERDSSRQKLRRPAAGNGGRRQAEGISEPVRAAGQRLRGRH